MPTYEYRCKSCDHEMEVQQSFSDDPLETCPKCEGRLRKVYGSVGISFKGSGFYKNDARSSSGTKKSAAAPAADSSSSGSSSSGDAASGSSGESSSSGDSGSSGSDSSSSSAAKTTTPSSPSD